MKSYLSILKIRFLMLLQYRVPAIAGIFTQFFFGFVRIMVFQAFYSNAVTVQPISLAQTVTYIWITQALFRLLPWEGDSEVQEIIKSGNLAYELVRPLDLYSLWLFRAIAQRLAPTLLRSIPLILITSLLPSGYSPELPSLSAFLSFIPTLALAFVLSATVTVLMNIFTLWTISGDGINRTIPALVLLFSGSLIPIPLFPNWMQNILKYMPFSGLLDTPVRFYTGNLPISELPPYIAIQVFWIFALIILGRSLLVIKLKSIVVQGG
ncbi:MAG: ABC-2 family transporter protein [bacterium]|nr:ABC-2 family transporter protein [bacterium]